MSRVNKVLIVGNGRVAKAFLQYLSQSANPAVLAVAQWHRSLTKSFLETCQDESPTHVWLAVSDDSIVEFAQSHSGVLSGKAISHFCGGKPSFLVGQGSSLVKVHAVHPLTTFGDISTSDWQTDFQSIPFVLDADDRNPSQLKLTDLLPGFKNPVFYLNADNRPFYHALCALAGGVSVQVWESVARRFETELRIPPEVLSHFLRQIGRNLQLHLENRRSVLTGPVARGDLSSIALHKLALETKHEVLLARLYQDFESLHRRDKTLGPTQKAEAP